MILKRIFYIGLGLSTHLLIFIGSFRMIFVNLISKPPNKDDSVALIVFLSLVLTLLVIGVLQLILYGFSYWQREKDSHIFYQFYNTLRRPKIIHHEHLGEFLLTFDKDNDLVLLKQNWFTCEEIGHYYLTDDTEKLSGKIQEDLNGLYKNIVKEEEQKKNIADKVNKIMSWDGYLDKSTRRDDKLDKLGIK
jgi:hypothetical protein